MEKNVKGVQPEGAATRTRHPTAEALLDATELLLIDVGYSGLSARRITDEAGQAHGSIRYHFGTLEGLIVAVVDRQTERITTRQRAMYAAPGPFSAKWRQAMTWFEEDLRSGYPKLAGELRAAAWNLPACRPGIQRVIDEWSSVLHDAVADAVTQLGLDVDDRTVAGVAGLIRTSQQAMLDDRLAGVDTDHTQVVEMIGRLLDDLEARALRAPDAPGPDQDLPDHWRSRGRTGGLGGDPRGGGPR